MFLAHNTTGTHLARQMRRWALLGSFLLAISSSLPLSAQTLTPATVVLPPVQLHIPMVAGGLATKISGCPETSTNQYDTLPILNEPRRPDPPPLLDPDLNLSIRGYKATTGTLEIININGPTDDDAPQLAHLFRPVRVPAFHAIHQVHAWDWSCRTGGCLGEPIDEPEVTLVEMATLPSEPLYPPGRNAHIGGDFIALVLYAEPSRLTFVYTGEDTPAHGYVVHVENFCVDPNLLARYEEMDEAGRANLPGLRRAESIGTASGESVLVAVRDSGSFMDPRSGKDWWQDTVRALLAAQ
jgi:hypothetical protein